MVLKAIKLSKFTQGVSTDRRGRAVVGTPLSYYKADALKNEGQLNKTLKDFSLFKYLRTLS